jgi:hypothetical protein
MSGPVEAVAGGGGNSDVTAIAAGVHAPARRRTGGSAIVDAALVFLFMSLLIDGFPAGAALLREFGSRPTDFLLIPAWLLLIARRLMRGQQLGMEVKESYLLVAIFVGAPLLNLPVALMQSDVGTRLTLIDWTKQFGMLAWGLTSYYIWRAIVVGMEPERYCALMSIGAVLPVLTFFLQYVDRSGSVAAFLDYIRMKRDPRPSSLATEPALYGAWIAFLWPLVLYYARAGGRALGRLAAYFLLLAAVVSALMSNARTFIVILLLQLIYFCYWALDRQRGWGARIRTLLLALCITIAAALALASRVMTVIDISSNGSDVTRFGDTVTGINVSLAHPLVGVGIGEFGNFFAQYAPAFALSSVEVDKNVVGDAEYRASTFNLFVRLCVEFGIPLGVFFTVIVVRPIFRAPKGNLGERFILYAAWSAVGGAGFWLSQDTYGYEPGILAMAVLTASLAGMMRHSGRRALAASET